MFVTSLYVITVTVHFKRKEWAFKDFLLAVLKISTVIKYLIMTIHVLHDSEEKLSFFFFLPFAFLRVVNLPDDFLNLILFFYYF